MMRAPLGVSAAILAVALAGCVGPISGAASHGAAPAASTSEPLHALAGEWRGSLTEVGGWYFTASTPLDLTLTPEGIWSGTIGGAAAEGRATMRGSHLVLSGTASPRGRTGYPIYLRLTGDEDRRWGQTLGRFGDRDERAMVGLRRVG